MVKNQLAMQEMQIQFPGQEDSLEKEMATILPGESHGQSSLLVIIHGVTKSLTRCRDLTTTATCGLVTCL